MTIQLRMHQILCTKKMGWTNRASNVEIEESKNLNRLKKELKGFNIRVYWGRFLLIVNSINQKEPSHKIIQNFQLRIMFISSHCLDNAK
ncbi:MAG: hypothetical protein K0R06_534 [Clostridium sp.]|jgi:hypothetical protein|nr:hypothetical protein [Clostridium sp.]